MKIQEIAREAGVSTATVSRVFSHHPNIREEVRRKVFAVARAYSYHPRLSTKLQNVVVVTPAKTRYPVPSHVEMILSELAPELTARDYRLEMLPADNLERLERIQFCGALAIGISETEFAGWGERFSVPLVLMDSPASGHDDMIYAVHSDEAQGMELAIERLAADGCRKIGALIHGAPGIGLVDVRIKCCFAAMKKHGLPADSGLVRTAFAEQYVEEIGNLLHRHVTGLFCPGGNAGILSAYALSLYDRKAPEDVSLIASERGFFSCYAVPPQTTISQEYPELARAAADLLDAFADRKEMRRNTVFPYRLIERGSTAPRPAPAR